MKVTFEGGKDIEKALLELKTSTAKSVVRRVLKRAAALFANRANSLAPDGEGELSSSYGVSTRLNRRQRGLARREGRSQVFMYAGTNDPGGMQQEFGNSRHGSQPHARPAWDQTKNKIFDEIQQEMAGEVEKAVARARRKAAKSAKP